MSFYSNTEIETPGFSRVVIQFEAFGQLHAAYSPKKGLCYFLQTQGPLASDKSISGLSMELFSSVLHKPSDHPVNWNLLLTVQQFLKVNTMGSSNTNVFWNHNGSDGARSAVWLVPKASEKPAIIMKPATLVMYLVFVVLLNFSAEFRHHLIHSCYSVIGSIPVSFEYVSNNMKSADRLGKCDGLPVTKAPQVRLLGDIVF